MKLDQDKIVDAAMAAFGDVGYDGLSMRQVARRLDAQAGSLYYHVKNKDELVRLMADRVTGHAYDQGSAALAALGSDVSWHDKIEAQTTTLRRAMLTQPGGALLLARSPGVLSEPALALMDRLLGTLADAGVPVADRTFVADTLLSYVTGFVLQEQSPAETPAVEPAEIAVVMARFAMVAASIAATPPTDRDTTFVRSIRFLCAAAEALRREGPTGPPAG